MYGDFAYAIFWCFLVYWCYVVIRRLPDDITEFREVKETVRRGVIIFIWLLTAVIAVVLIVATIKAIPRIIDTIRSLL